MSIEALKAECADLQLPVSDKHMENMTTVLAFVNEHLTTPKETSVEKADKPKKSV